MNPVEKLHSLGQSIWYDNIERKLLSTGDLALMIEQDRIRGITSNPSIFKNAIANSSDYDEELIPLAKIGKTKEEIYEKLAITDIQAACDLFRSLYKKTRGGDGYVSFEVNPFLANDAEATIEDARRLWDLVDRENLMIKIPATVNGLKAISETIASGINVNVTLIFSIKRYKAVIEAYVSGLEKRLSLGRSINRIASVSSFFVSRIDSIVDNRLDAILDGGDYQHENAMRLKGNIAVANAKLAFDLHKNFFNDVRFIELAAMGARVQRVLWASTSTKNPEYSDTKYVDELIGPNTINTIPPKTLLAFQEHGSANLTLEHNLSGAKYAFEDLKELGISISEVTDELEVKGVQAFASDYSSLLESIDKRRLELI